MSAAVAGPHEAGRAHQDRDRGEIEVQDEGAQIAAVLAGAQPGMRVLDYCAGARSKTLALAAAMKNSGTLTAHDSDAKRRGPLAKRSARAGASIIEVRSDAKIEAGAQRARYERIPIDVPCSGSGTWRRRPDLEWRLTPALLDRYRRLQTAILDRTAPWLADGGRLVYVTCSVLPCQSERQIAGFLARFPGYRLVPLDAIWRATLGALPAAPTATLQLTPLRRGTDGFFIAMLERR